MPTGQQHDIWLHDCIVYLCQQNSFMLAISALGIQGINEYIIMFSGNIYGLLSSKGYKAIARAITYFQHRI